MPFDWIPLLVSTVLGAVLKLWSHSQEDKARQTDLLIQRTGMQRKMRKDVLAEKSKGFAWTKRFIVVTTVLSVIVLPIWAPIFVPNLTVVHGWAEWNPGFLFIEGKDSMIWHEVKGIAITPMHTMLVEAIAGLYLGYSMVNRR